MENQQVPVQIPRIDLQKFLESRNDAQSCKELVDSLHQYGVVVIKDPRVEPKANEEFLDMMEEYFQKRQEEYDNHQDIQQLTDCYPQYGFQTGVTPDLQEQARDHSHYIAQHLTPPNLPATKQVAKDKKWRYFWGMKDYKCNTNNNNNDNNDNNNNTNNNTNDNNNNNNDKELQLIPPKAIPKDFPKFQSNMDRWGGHMLDSIYTVSEMIAVGLGLNEQHFRCMLEGGPHLLAPTGSNLQKYPLGSIFAGFHYDFNFLTIHGKSRYPGLSIWLRNGQKQGVKVDEGDLLIQAGKAIELLTGGHIMCGYHEVVHTQQSEQQKLKVQGRPHWRVSSTLFSHCKPHVLLQSHNMFNHNQHQPPITAYQLMEQELKMINLSPNNN